METEEKPGNPVTVVEKPKRSVLFVATCLFAWVFYAILVVIYFLPVIFPGRFTETLNKYAPDEIVTRGQVIFFAFTISLLHALAFTGTILMWLHHKWGYWLFGITTLSITVFQLFQDNVKISATLVYILLLIIFGLFSRKK
jgi:hypothetical protein